MKSFTDLRNLYGTLSNNSSPDNLTLGDELINDSIRQICEAKAWYFLEKTKTTLTVANQQTYNLPFDCKKLINVTIIIGTTKYTPEECTSRDFWDYLNSSTSVTSDTPVYYFIFNNQLNFYPIPSSGGNTITYSYIKGFRDLSLADYTTGTITTTSGTTLTGSGTTWTVPMAGRFLRITASDTVSSGDGIWYEISSVSSATSITLVDSYNGTALSGATGTYIIGDLSPLPEAYQVLPVYSALETYFSTKTEDLSRSQFWGKKFADGYENLNSFYGRKSTNVVLSENIEILNPNNYITL